MYWSDSWSETGRRRHLLQGARDLGRGGARHRGRVGVGDVLGRLVGGVVLERRGLILGRGRRRRLRLQGLVGVLRLRHRSVRAPRGNDQLRSPRRRRRRYDFKGPLFKPRKNVQDPSNCPAGDAIYFRQFDPSTPPPVLAADQEASSSSCTRDAYGKCVPAGCASYFDGCNTCNVGAVLGCTMMFCDTPQEPKCLEYKKD